MYEGVKYQIYERLFFFSLRYFDIKSHFMRNKNTFSYFISFIHFILFKLGKYIYFHSIDTFSICISYEYKHRSMQLHVFCQASPFQTYDLCISFVFVFLIFVLKYRVIFNRQ